MAYCKQLPLQRMVVAYDKLVGVKTPLLKEIQNIYMKSEMKTQTINGSPLAVMATVGSWMASQYKWSA